MVIKVSTLLAHNTELILDLAPTLGGPLNTNNFPIENGINPVTITGNEYPLNNGTAGQVLTTNGTGILSWQNTEASPLTLTGDITGSGIGTVDTTLATVNGNIGTFGDATHVGSFTVNNKGLITSASNIEISLTSSEIITALGYTPYNAVNPAGYISSAAISTLTDVTLSSLTTGQVLEYNGTDWVNVTLLPGGVTSFNTRTGPVTLTSSDVTTALGFTPGTGSVTSVSVVTANGISGSVATSTTTPAITLTLGDITPTSVAATGTITGSNLSGTNTGDQTITLTGDVTGSGTGSFVTTLATVNPVPVTDSLVKISVNGKGLVTDTFPVTLNDLTNILGTYYLPESGGTMYGTLNMGGFTIQSLGTPVNPDDAANKAYVDAAVQILDVHASVQVATTVDLNATYTNGTIDANGGLGIGATLTNAGTQAALIIDGYTVSPYGPIALLGTITPGSGYVNGHYTNVPLSGNIGTGATANITVAGGIVTLVTLDNPGIGYVATGGVGAILTLGTFASGGNGILTLGTLVPGGNYLPGTYTGVPLTGGSGTGAIATIVVNGATNVSSVTITSLGSGYVNGDVLSALSSYLGVVSTPYPFSIYVTTTSTSSNVLSATNSTLGGGTGLGFNVLISTVGSGGSGSALSTSNINLGGSGSGFNIPITTVFGDRVLVKNQPNQIQNGIYTVTNTGSNSTNWILTRAIDYNNSILNQVIPGSFVFVTNGTQANTGWDEIGIGTYAGGAIIIGTDNIIFSQFSGTGVLSDIAGTGISLSNTTGNVTITNTGVLSFQTSLSGLTPTTATTGVVTLAGVLGITSGGTGQITKQAAFDALSPLVTAGDILYYNGTNNINLGIGTAGQILTIVSGEPTWLNPAAQTLKLYSENASTYTPPFAAATNSVAIGEGAQTEVGAIDSLALGNQSLARTQGEIVQASGRFASTGDAQAGRYLLRSATINGSPTELFIDGTAGSVRLVLTDDCTWTFKVTVTGHRTDASDGHAGYTAAGVIYRNAGVSTTAIQGSVQKSVLGESNPPWDINIAADPTNGSLRITVTGEAGKTIRWVALVETVEVTN